ncbi:hypothetical protein DOE76_05830 [Leifsonia sp. ku-ls]|nr:hypothetical protein DOE76_05830 [Leifsonia sp. ku-ls]
MDLVDPYAETRWVPRTGEGLSFDEQYRAAHLPHVAPEHPRRIDHWEGHGYHHGRYDPARVSLVADLGRSFLTRSGCRRLVSELAASSFATKVAFDMIERRAANLHCTLLADIDFEPTERRAANRVLSAAPPLEPVLHGPFIGRFNRGRIYLPVEFDRAADQRLLTSLSGIFGASPPIVTAVGLVNLREELDPGEAQEMTAILLRLRDQRSRLAVPTLSWTSTHDDLTLDMRRLETIALTGGRPSLKRLSGG